MRILVSLSLLLIATANLFLVLHTQYQVAAMEQMLVLDAALGSLSSAPVLKDSEKAEAVTRGLALRDALRAYFGWGRFRGISLPADVREAFWEEVVVGDDCKGLIGKDLTIQNIFWGTNYARVTPQTDCSLFSLPKYL